MIVARRGVALLFSPRLPPFHGRFIFPERNRMATARELSEYNLAPLHSQADMHTGTLLPLFYPAVRLCFPWTAAKPGMRWGIREPHHGLTEARKHPTTRTKPISVGERGFGGAVLSSVSVMEVSASPYPAVTSMTFLVVARGITGGADRQVSP